MDQRGVDVSGWQSLKLKGSCVPHGTQALGWGLAAGLSSSPKEPLQGPTDDPAAAGLLPGHLTLCSSYMEVPTYL